MDELEMNRCKLCGAEPILSDLYYGWYVVRCSDSTCSNSIEHSISDSKERAIRRWNNRNPEVTEGDGENALEGMNNDHRTD